MSGLRFKTDEGDDFKNCINNEQGSKAITPGSMGYSEIFRLSGVQIRQVNL